MNFVHMQIGHVSRSSGRSSVQAVAYVTGTCMNEERRGMTADYSNRGGVEAYETLAPEGSGISKDDLEIWNRLENYEDEYALKRYKTPETQNKYMAEARTAQTYIYALPKELTLDQNQELIREHIEERFVSKGLVATYGIHFEEGNPHVHIAVSTRTVLDGEISWTKEFSRELASPSGIRETRAAFANTVNKYQEMIGISDRVDHRSYAERGIDLIPTFHKGWRVHNLERDGIDTRIATENNLISEENKERVSENCSIIIQELTSKQATFSELDVTRVVNKRLKDDTHNLAEHVIYSVLKEAVEVGTGLDHGKRYTSQSYKDKEDQILESLTTYSTQKASIQIEDQKVEDLLQGEAHWLNEGQKNAVMVLCGDANLSVLIGRAGTGKTTSLKYVVRLHEEAGYTVIGMGPSATAASQLGSDTGCQSDTIAHHAYYWEKYHSAVESLKQAEEKGSVSEKERASYQDQIDRFSVYLPTAQSLILVDEAGMVGVGDWRGGKGSGIAGGWASLAKTLDLTKSKLILVGDDHQFKPVEAGDVFRKIIETLRGLWQVGELSEIRRQNVPWMRDASHHLAELRTGQALEIYERQGHIDAYDTHHDTHKAIAQQYLRNTLQYPKSDGLVLAYTNEECSGLNQEIRKILRENGLLSTEDIITKKDVSYGIGDKIVFTKNDRGYNTEVIEEEKGGFLEDLLENNAKSKGGFFVRNGMMATIDSIKPIRMEDRDTGEIIDTYRITASVEGNRTVTFRLNEYKDFQHGYAVTSHKSQGATVDWNLLKLSPYMDAHALYVAMTRHRDDFSALYSKQDFGDFGALIKSASRVGYKDLVADYTISDEAKEFWLNVQDYKDYGHEMLGIRALATHDGATDKADIWKEYKNVQGARAHLAKIILDNRPEHVDFVRQAGLTFESLEIAANVRKRPLSRLETEAQLVVEQFGAVSLEARGLWLSIRKTHPGARARNHPDYQMFEEARNQRGILANLIVQNPVIHKPFLKELDEGLGIGYGMSVIKAQAEAHQSKMLMAELLKNVKDPEEVRGLRNLMAYVEARNEAGEVWKELRPKLKSVEGTLLSEGFCAEIDAFNKVRMSRDKLAATIVHALEDHQDLSLRVGMKLDVEKLFDQSEQYSRDHLLETYTKAENVRDKLLASVKLSEMMKDESLTGKKTTVGQVYRYGLNPQNIGRDVIEYKKLEVLDHLTSDADKQLFVLLDDYEGKCFKTNQAYFSVMQEVKEHESSGKGDIKPWNTSHYSAYLAERDIRDSVALEIIDQHALEKVEPLATAMGLKSKDHDPVELMLRSEQANRNQVIKAFLGVTKESEKYKAGEELIHLIESEKRAYKGNSATGAQSYHAGIDVKTLKEEIFAHKRVLVFSSLSTDEEKTIFHGLQEYEKASHAARLVYRNCMKEIEEKAAKNPQADPVKPWESDKFKDYLAAVVPKDALAHDLQQHHAYPIVSKIAQSMEVSLQSLDLEAHRHALRGMVNTFVSEGEGRAQLAGKEVFNWLDFDQSDKDLRFTTFKVLRESELMPKDIVESLEAFAAKRNTFQSEKDSGAGDIYQEQSSRQDTGANSTPISLYKVNTPREKFADYLNQNRLSSDQINTHLRTDVESLALELFQSEKIFHKTSREIRFGNKGAVCVQISGPKQGMYSDFSTGISTDTVGMISERLGLDRKEAFKWGIKWIGGKSNDEHYQEFLARKQQEQTQKPENAWTPVFPVPKAAPEPDLKNNQFLTYIFKDKETKETKKEATFIHAYKDQKGDLLGYVVRIEPIDKDGSKITLPMTYCSNKEGQTFWKWKGFGDNRPIYGLEKLSENKEIEKLILIVEGEKTAEVAQKKLPGYTVLSWQGGSGAVAKVDWSPLIGRDVTIWPDNDEPGFKAAAIIKESLGDLNKTAGHELSPKIVKLPEGLPEKWDLGDKRPEGVSKQAIIDSLKGEPSKALSPEAHEDKDRAKISAPPKNLTFEQVNARVKELKLDRAIQPAEEGLEKLVTQVHKHLGNVSRDYNVTRNPEKLMDQSIYVALRIQFGSCIKEFEDKDFLPKVCLESRLFINNPDQVGMSMLIKAKESLKDIRQPEIRAAKELQKDLDSDHIQTEKTIRVPHDKGQILDHQTQEIYQKFMGKQAKVTPDTLNHVKKFEHSMNVTIKTYEHETVQKYAALAQARQMSRQQWSFQNEI